MAAARAAYIAGFATTSNLAARQRYGVPTAGTSAHSFTLLHDTEADAFRAQVDVARARAPRCWSTPTTSPRRCGSGSRSPARSSARSASTPATSACSPSRSASSSTRSARTNTRIVVTCDLDEYAIAALAAAPVDGYGVGTPLVTGSGHPTCGFVYKLVAREGDDGEMVGVAKKSKDKISIGGRKYALRRRDAHGVAEAEVIGIGEPPVERRRRPRRCWSPLVRGRRGGRPRAARDAPRAARGARAPSCRCAARQISRGEPVIPTEHLEGRLSDGAGPLRLLLRGARGRHAR